MYIYGVHRRILSIYLKQLTYDSRSIDVVRSEMVGERVERDPGVVVGQHVGIAVLAGVLLLQGCGSGARFSFVRAQSAPFLLQTVLIAQVIFHISLLKKFVYILLLFILLSIVVLLRP